jgi:NAD(P)H-hydrate epimerase
VRVTIRDRTERRFFSTAAGRAVPAVSVREMAEVDRIAVEQSGPTLLQMMELAGEQTALTAIEMLGATHGPDWEDARVLVLVGTGSNGAGGVCAARHLANRGVDVTVVTIRRPTEADGALGQELLALAEAPARVITWDEAFDAGTAQLVIDAVIGYSLDGAPRARQMALIRASHAAGGPVLSLDVPSGLDPDTGEAPGVVVRPARTLTLGLPKLGLRQDNAGELWLADLGIPPGVYARAGIAFAPVFGTESRVRLEYPSSGGAVDRRAGEGV